MLKIKKINKIIWFSIFIIIFFSCKKEEYQLMEPEKFISILEKEVLKHYYFNNSIPLEEYLRTVKIFEPELKNISTLNAKDYFIEILRQNYKKDLFIAENFYRKAIYELLKNFKGRNIYIVPSTLALLNDKNNNAGIGIVLYEEEMGKFFIIDVIEGSPAYLADIKPNLYLQAIDNISVSNFFLEDVVARIKGKPKTKINVTIQDNNYELYRSTYQFLPIRKTNWKINNKNILYLQIRFAIDGVSNQIKQFLLENQNPDFLILDIRYLSHGNLEEILKIADLFIPKKQLLKVHIKDQNPQILSSTENIYYTGKIIILHQSKTTPYAYALARLLEEARDSIIIGPLKEVPIYIGIEIPIKEEQKYYGSFYFTNGYVEFINKANFSKWISVENFIPTYPPGPKPNLEDPYHKKLLDIIK
ncbi:MAG: hypothetical protein KatS3mg129_2726 [Leptospiraceae bacterium]|nr:MAG: hypothetical protein KatS3mg129_2726 [Leptospiraceae bacterium]